MSGWSDPPRLSWLSFLCEQGRKDACSALARTVLIATAYNELLGMALLGYWPIEIPERGLPEIPLPPLPSPLKRPEEWARFLRKFEMVSSETWVKEAKNLKNALENLIQFLDECISGLE